MGRCCSISGMLSVGSCSTFWRSLVGIMKTRVRGLLSENVAVECCANATLLCIELMTSVSKHQAFFSQFSRKFHECLPTGPNTPLIALTGGFKTYATINSALANDHAELIGIGRLSIHDSHVPIRLRSEGCDLRRFGLGSAI